MIKLEQTKIQKNKRLWSVREKENKNGLQILETFSLAEETAFAVNHHI